MNGTRIFRLISKSLWFWDAGNVTVKKTSCLCLDLPCKLNVLLYVLIASAHSVTCLEINFFALLLNIPWYDLFNKFLSQSGSLFLALCELNLPLKIMILSCLTVNIKSLRFKKLWQFSGTIEGFNKPIDGAVFSIFIRFWFVASWIGFFLHDGIIH